MRSRERLLSNAIYVRPHQFPPNFYVYNNYNFAVARVRLRGTAGPAGAAKNVRVFFRLWSTESADADYLTGSTYPSTSDAAGQPGSPLVGTGHNTLPFFASGNLSGNMDYAAGGANIRDIQINSGDSIWAYYGCFLNLWQYASRCRAGGPREFGHVVGPSISPDRPAAW